MISVKRQKGSKQPGQHSGLDFLQRRPGEQGQSGLEEPSGKDSEQLSQQSDRELKMEQKEDGRGHRVRRQPRAVGPITLHARNLLHGTQEFGIRRR